MLQFLLHSISKQGYGMRKGIMGCLLGVFGLFTSLGALATPTQLYTFKTHQTRCISAEGVVDCANSFDHRPALDQMYYQISGVGGGSVSIEYMDSLQDVFNVQGLAALRLVSYPNPGPIDLDPGSNYWDNVQSPFTLYGEFWGGRRPSASFYMFDYSDEIAMGDLVHYVVDSGWHGTDFLDESLLLQPKGPFEVSGLIIGDSNHPTFFSFTGRWHMANQVPEPNTGGLLLGALFMAGLVTFRRARAMALRTRP